MIRTLCDTLKGMDVTPTLAYTTYMNILQSGTGQVPVCVALIDPEGNPAVLTTVYSVDGIPSLNDWDMVHPETMYRTLAQMMVLSRRTIREYGGTPLEEAQ